MRITATALAIAVCIPLAAAAQEAPPAPPPAPPPPPPPAAEPAPAPAPMPAPEPAPMVAAPAPAPAPAAASAPALTWEALVDAYYAYNFTGDPNTQGPTGRAFDLTSNSFTLNYMKLGAGYDAGPAAFRIDLGYGHTGSIINGFSASGSSMAAPAPALYSSAFVVQQAYASLKLLGGQLQIDGGKFVTWAGAEVIESNKNWLYSRSFLFNGIPLLHTGVRAFFKANDMLTIALSMTNGAINNNDPDISGDKVGGINIAIAPVSTTNIYLTGYFGKGETSFNPAPGEMYILADAVVAQTINEQISLNLNFDYEKQGDLNWWGAALMGKFQIVPEAYVAARAEYLKSKAGGYSSIPMLADGSAYEGTLMLGLPVAGHFEARAEVRGDFASEKVFAKGAEPKKSQFTGLLSFLAFTN